MAGTEHRVFRQSQYLFQDAPLKVSRVSARKVPDTDASFENRVSHKGDPVPLGVVNHGIRGMARGIEYPQREIRVCGQFYGIAVVQILHVPDRDGLSGFLR